MWTMKELIEMETPFLSMVDITEADWRALDFELEKYDRSNQSYDLNECKVLAFVLQQIHYNKIHFNDVPNYIRNGRQFQELVVKYNPSLALILFPMNHKDEHKKGDYKSRMIIEPMNLHEEKTVRKIDNDLMNGTPINPDELELIYKEGAVGVHDLFKQHGLSISYKAADMLWCDYSQDIFKVSCKPFPTKEIVLFKDYAQKLFVSLYLYDKKIITSPDDWCEVDFALCKILKMDI